MTDELAQQVDAFEQGPDDSMRWRVRTNNFMGMSCSDAELFIVSRGFHMTAFLECQHRVARRGRLGGLKDLFLAAETKHGSRKIDDFDRWVVQQPDIGLQEKSITSAA